MKFKSIEDAKKYLESLDYIIIPKEYTYILNASTYCFPELDKLNNKTNWLSLPTEQFIVKNEMSYWSRSQITEEVMNGTYPNGKIVYGAQPDTTESFQIRVIFPNSKLTEAEINKIGMTPEEYKNLCLKNYQMNLGWRHPKIFNGDVVEIFASSYYDELSGTKQDILYGVRQQDIIKYAELVSEELEKSKNIPLGQNPATKDDINYEWSHQTISLKKSQNKKRFQNNIYIKGLKGKHSLFEYMYVEHLKANGYNLEQFFGNEHKNTISNIEELLGRKITPINISRQKTDKELFAELKQVQESLQHYLDIDAIDYDTHSYMSKAIVIEYKKMIADYKKTSSGNDFENQQEQNPLGNNNDSKIQRPYIRDSVKQEAIDRESQKQQLNHKRLVEQFYKKEEEIVDKDKIKRMYDLLEEFNRIEMERMLKESQQELEEDLEDEIGMSM